MAKKDAATERLTHASRDMGEAEAMHKALVQNLGGSGKRGAEKNSKDRLTQYKPKSRTDPLKPR